MLPEKQSKVLKSRPPSLNLPPPSRKEKSSLKKLKPPHDMRKKIYQCSKKNVTTIIGAPAKNGQGGGQEQKYPEHTEKMASTWREDCPHRKKYPNRGTPPPNGIFLFMTTPPPPGKRLLFSPRRATTMSP